MTDKLNGAAAVQDYSLGTYGKLLRAIWPKIDLKQGPVGLVNQLLAQSNPPVTVDDIMQQYGRLPALMAEYVARQERIEGMLTILCDELDRAREAAKHGDRRNDDHDDEGIKLIGPGPGPDSGSSNGRAGSSARSGSSASEGKRGAGGSGGGHRKGGS